MGLGYVTGRARAHARVIKACVETLEERRLLAGHGELFTVEPQGYSSAGAVAAPSLREVSGGNATSRKKWLDCAP